MASFKIVATKLPVRPAMMLIREPYAFPGARDVVVPYDMVAPGLYPDETVYQLDSGERVALSISTARKPNGGGMDFFGWARVIKDDGSTMLDAAGEEMELEFRHPVTAPAFDALDQDGEPAEIRISREIMLLMLGAEPTMLPVHVDPDAPPLEIAVDDADWRRSVDAAGRRLKAPPGTVLHPEKNEAALIGWSDEVRMNASIRHAIKLFGRSQPEVDVSGLLAKG